MATLIHTLTNGDGKLITELRMEDGYINATKMAKAAGKKLSNWLQNKTTRDYLEGFSIEAGIAASMLVQQKHGKGDQQGTWVHPEIAVDVAAWCSVPFKIQVNRLVVRYLIGEISSSESAEVGQNLTSVD